MYKVRLRLVDSLALTCYRTVMVIKFYNKTYLIIVATKVNKNHNNLNQFFY